MTVKAAPEGWRTAKLGDVARVETGGTPSRVVPAYWGGDIPWMASGEVNLRKVLATGESITAEGLSQSNAKVFGPKTLMLAMNGQGRTRGMVARLGIPAACNQSLAAILAGSDAIQNFLFHVLDSRYEEIRGLTGDGRSGLNLGLIRGLQLLLPPLPEQRAIASILDSIDDAIDRTEEVIAATENLRKALLQDLLTNGVPRWHTEWKDVPRIGRIPAAWEVVRLGDVVEEFRYGTSVHCTLDATGTPVIRIPNVVRGRLDLSDLKFARLPDGEAKLTRLKSGDFLVVRTNGNPDLCGRGWVVSGLTGEWNYASYLIRIRVCGSVLNPDYLKIYMYSSVGRRELYGIIRTSAGNYNLSVDGLFNITIAVPSMEEQLAMLESISHSESTISSLESELQQRRTLKNGIAKVLLSGTVQVGGMSIV